MIFPGFLPLPKSNYNKLLVNLSFSFSYFLKNLTFRLIIGYIIYFITNFIANLWILDTFVQLFIVKYIKKDMQLVLNIVLEAQNFNEPRKKLLEGRYPDVYYNKSYIKYYNLC